MRHRKQVRVVIQRVCLNICKGKEIKMIRNTYEKAIVAGLIAGSRCMSAPAFVSNYLVKRDSPELADSNLRLMGSARTAEVFRIAAVGEMIADKMPRLSDRTDAASLGIRILSGALCGVAICRADGKRARVGAVAGGLAALAATYASFYLRKDLREATDIPDALLGAAEDSLVVGGGLNVFGNKATANY